MKRAKVFGIAAIVGAIILLTFAISSDDFRAAVIPTSIPDSELQVIGGPYYLGDTIQVTGKINDPNVDFITIEILDEQKNMIMIEKYGVGETNGQFTKNFPIVKDWTNTDWKTGTHTVRIAATGIELSKSFDVYAFPKDQAVESKS
jgi:hypothetical protein